jgi:hypothetical protein
MSGGSMSVCSRITIGFISPSISVCVWLVFVPTMTTRSRCPGTTA